MAEHVADNILIGVTRVALPMVHGHDGADAQERFNGTDTILIVAQGNALHGRHRCLQSVRHIVLEQCQSLVDIGRAGGDVFNISQEGGGVFDDDISVIEVLVE